MPNRIIKETIKSSPQIDSLSWFEEVVFYRLIVTADDYGCMDGRTVLLKNELFPTKDTVTRKAVEDAISHLVSVGLLRRYEANGMPYLFFPSWEKHQRIRNMHRKYPDPNACQTIYGQLTASCQSESESNPNPIQSESEVSAEISAPVALLPLNDGTDYAVSETKEREWAALFPAVDVAQELREMRAWLMANKARRKTRNGIERFVVSWLGREQDRGRPAANIKTKPPEERSAPGRKEFEAMRRMLGGQA